MLFSKEFDSSLWFILKSDKKYRKEIMGILNNMSQELYKKIQVEIEKANIEFEKNPDAMEDKLETSETIIGKDGYIYGFSLSYCCGMELNLFKAIQIKDTLRTVFNISLQELSEYKNRDYEEWLGNIDANITDANYEYCCDETEYLLYSNSVFSMVIHSVDTRNNRNTLPRVKFVKGKNPTDLTIEKLNSPKLKRTMKK